MVPLDTSANPYAPPRSDVGLGDRAHAMAGSLAERMPPPPDLHWALVLLLSMFSWSIFYYVWIFRQAAWIKRIDPSSHVTLLQVVALLLTLIGWAITFGSSGDVGTAGLGALVTISSWVFLIWAIFSVRNSMRNYFNTEVPIGLRLSGPMTFFFHTLYFQHHMSRLARWKQTGVLTPQ